MVAVHRYSQRLTPVPLDRETVQVRARQLLTGDLAIVDFETTGLVDGSRIVQIGIVDQRGEPLLETLVNPRMLITPEASAVHGLIDADVAGAPTLWQVWPELRRILASRAPLSFNAGFESRVLADHLAATPTPPIMLEWTCIMRLYQVYSGTMRGGLAGACTAEGIVQPVAHRALDDAMSAQRLLVAMAGQAPPVDETTYNLRLAL